jgi:uncharacterized SAM-binding protein YcdF (DUF218 family)
VKRRLAWLMVAIISWLGGVAGWIVIGPSITGVERGETAIVLGAAVDGDVPSPVFAARIDHAIDLYREGRVKRLLLTGGKSPEDRLSEAETGAAYARDRGVPTAVILLESQSSTTRQNLENAWAILGSTRDAPVVIVSDPLHMRRAMAMAADVGFNAWPSPTPTSRYRSLATQLPFLAREVWFMHMHWLLGV